MKKGIIFYLIVLVIGSLFSCRKHECPIEPYIVYVDTTDVTTVLPVKKDTVIKELVLSNEYIQDTYMSSYLGNDNYSKSQSLMSNAWTVSGNTEKCYILMKFDYFSLPEIIELISAELTLSADTSPYFVGPSPNRGHYGNNLFP